MVIYSEIIALHSAKLHFVSGLQSEAIPKSCIGLEKLASSLAEFISQAHCFYMQ